MANPRNVCDGNGSRRSLLCSTKNGGFSGYGESLIECEGKRSGLIWRVIGRPRGSIPRLQEISELLFIGCFCDDIFKRWRIYVGQI